MVRLVFLARHDVSQQGTARRYRWWIVAADLQRIVNKRTKAERVLALLIESGVLYIFSGAMLVAASLIRLPGSHFVLGSLYSQPRCSPSRHLPTECRHSREPRIIDGQDALQFDPPRSHHRLGQAAVKSTHTGIAVAGLQIADAARGSFDSSLSQLSLPSTSSPEADVDPEIRSEIASGGD